MLLRAVLLIIVTTSLMLAESNTTIEDEFPTDKSKSNQSLEKSSKLPIETSNSSIANTDTNQSVKVIPRGNNSAADTVDTTNRSQETNSTLNLLEGYNSVTAAGVLQSEPEDVNATVMSKDDNSSDLISPTAKLDDVSNLDIVKAQRKQRKTERAEEKVENQSRALIDTIVVKGSVLQGQITQLTAEYIQFRLIYGSGSIRIKYSDIESIQTEHEYHIYFDGKETEGYITGIEGGAFLKVMHGEVEELITISKIDRFVISINEDDSIENHLRNIFPYWSGNIDIGVELERGSNNKRKVKIAGHVERNKGANRTFFDIRYEYELTKTVDTNTTVLNKDEQYLFGENNYFFYPQQMLFVQCGYDYDIPRAINGRVYPALGYGYKLGKKRDKWVQFKLGAGYVYEDFVGYSYDEYMAGFFGVDARYKIDGLGVLDGVLLEGIIFYMPGMKDYQEQWLLRNNISISFPIGSSLSFKTVYRNVNDNNPAPDVGNNKYNFDLYLSANF